jgi:hypothetical protein
LTARFTGSLSIETSSDSVGFCPSARKTVPSFLTVITPTKKKLSFLNQYQQQRNETSSPSPSLSNTANASLNSATCSAEIQRALDMNPNTRTIAHVDKIKGNVHHCL